METCGTCKFWGDAHSGRSICRRHPPQLSPTPSAWAMWPATDQEDWCGEHKPEEEK